MHSNQAVHNDQVNSSQSVDPAMRSFFLNRSLNLDNVPIDTRSLNHSLSQRSLNNTTQRSFTKDGQRVGVNSFQGRLNFQSHTFPGNPEHRPQAW
jgi:hypothetical protein